MVERQTCIRIRYGANGNDFPEMVAAWYVEHGYNFLALSDHNVLQSRVRWMPLDKIISRSDEKKIWSVISKSLQVVGRTEGLTTRC